MKPRKKAVIVDDDANTLRILEALLQKQFEIITFTSGEDILSYLELDPPELIILDVMMPEIHGIDLCKKIRSDARFNSIPIAMMSAIDSIGMTIDSIEAGADVFISKRASHREFLARINEVIQENFYERASLRSAARIADA